MICFNLFNKILKNQDAIQSFIMFIGIIFTGWQTWKLHNLSKEENSKLFELSALEKQKDFLNSQLIELQRMSFYDPFVEDEKFTKKWVEYKTKYENKTISDEEKKLLLKYDVYTEMLFNFLEMSYKVYKNEEDLLNYVDFKSWLRTHSECWKNPLQAHSNQETYDEKLCLLVDKWLK